jgi:hypothetical protein
MATEAKKQRDFAEMTTAAARGRQPAVFLTAIPTAHQSNSPSPSRLLASAGQRESDLDLTNRGGP